VVDNPALGCGVGRKTNLSEDGHSGAITSSLFTEKNTPLHAHNLATLGQDRYLLTNPAGLRMLNTGLEAEARTEWRGLTLLGEGMIGEIGPF
jgi:hypothetical protein